MEGRVGEALGMEGRERQALGMEGRAGRGRPWAGRAGRGRPWAGRLTGGGLGVEGGERGAQGYGHPAPKSDWPGPHQPLHTYKQKVYIELSRGGRVDFLCFLRLLLGA